MAKEIEVRKIKVDTDEAVESMEALEGATDDVAESNDKLESQLDDMPGPLGKVKQGIQGLSKAFKALLANPIVALIAAIVLGLTLLAKAFTKTQAGGDKVKDIMSAISATIEVLTERAAKLFKALGKLFKGDFKGAAEDAKAAVSGVKDEIIEATKAAIEYEKAVRKVFKAETDLITADAERRKQISELRFLSRDLTASYQERIGALEKAAAIEVAGLEETVALQQAKVDLIKTEIANTPETLRTREQARTLAEAEVALLDLQTASIEQQKGLLDEVNAIRAEAKSAADAAIAEEEAKQAERDAAAKEKRKIESDERKEQAELDRQFQEDMAAETLARETELAAEQKRLNDEQTAAMIANAEQVLAAEIAAEQEKIAIRQGSMNATNAILGDGFAALGGFLAEGSKLQKKLQIADATRAAIMGAIQAYQSAAAIPVVGSILGPIAAAAALAAGMANVKKIASVSDPTGGGAAVPSVSLARPAAGVDSRNLVNADQNIPTEVAVTQSSAQREPVKTYVVQSDVTAKQDIERERQREATL
jgi:tetrahydromethanopterin S-methyltransferase subunit B